MNSCVPKVPCVHSCMRKDKRITLTDSIIRDITIVAAEAGTSAKTYIENMVTNHLIELGYPKKKSKLVITHPDGKKK